MPMPDASPELKPTDLRGILKYVPMWRDHTFVIALDGALVMDEAVGSLFVDLAVLRSLQIKVVLVYGIGQPLEELAAARGVTLTDTRGEEPVDAKTLELALEADARVQRAVTRRLLANGLQWSITSAARATEVGVLHGIDQGHRGKIERIDSEVLRPMMSSELIPVLGPIVYARDGSPLRVNSDTVALATAQALQASKLLFLVAHPGLTHRGEFVLNVPADEVRAWLTDDLGAIDAPVRSKALAALAAIDAGVPRVHLLDGRTTDGLLTEVFSQVGIGTMIHGNAYQEIRPARKKDIPAIQRMLKQATSSGELRRHGAREMLDHPDHYFVYEIDGSLLGCAALIPYPEENVGEIAAVYVQPFFRGKNAGHDLVRYACERAAAQGLEAVFALTTQSTRFFGEVCGFTAVSPDELPASRRERYDREQRRSVIYKQVLTPTTGG